MKSASIQNPKFQSTLSVRRATARIRRTFLDQTISIHALREESDPQVHFMHLPIGISIHALREESDRMPDQTATAWRNFNPRSP